MCNYSAIILMNTMYFSHVCGEHMNLEFVEHHKLYETTLDSDDEPT